MEFRGTKGEWVITNNTVKVNECSKLFMTISSGVVSNSVVAVSYSRHNLEYEVKYNALLISKAPEMLEMLKSILASEYLKGTIEESKLKQLIKEATTI